jgi:acid phosphatase family membrane protein YuiD
MEWTNWLYLIVPIVANVSAHAIKYSVKLSIDHKTKPKTFFHSGGVVSAHNATFFSLATLVGLVNGFDTPLFAIAAFLACVVAYDSINVRRATGEQGDALAKLVKSGKKPFNALGHTPTEMILGAVWGILLGIGAYLIIF